MELNEDADVERSAKRFLDSSSLCDLKNGLVRQTAVDLVRETCTAREAAIAIYYFVRDDIKHEWGPTGQAASATLRRRTGDCWPKSILQVALLRAVHIPARFHWFEYRKHLFADLVPAAIYRSLADPFPFHAVAEVFLGDQWIKADATFDKDLRPDRAMDWDGANDLVTLRSNETTRDLGYTKSFEERQPQIDELFAKLSMGDKTDDDVNTESELVNLNFDLIRLKNRLELASDVLIANNRGH